MSLFMFTIGMIIALMGLISSETKERQELEKNQPIDTIAYMTKIADSLFKAKDTITSIKKYEEIIKKKPDKYTYFSLGHIYFLKKEYRKTVEYQQEAFKLDTLDHTILNSIGNSYSYFDKIKAMECWQKAKSMGNKDACKSIREETKIIVSYEQSGYRCCDGREFSGTPGKGACSGHKGVCQTLQRPVYKYTVECN